MAYHIQPFYTLCPALGQSKSMLLPCQKSSIVSVNSEVIGLSIAKGNMNQAQHMRTRQLLSYKCFLSKT